MKYKDLAEKIVANVGGKENVKSLVHCVTRLRFQVKDEGHVNIDNLNNLDGVLKVIRSGGQHQVVIGNHVSEVFKAVNHVMGGEVVASDADVDGDNKNAFDKLFFENNREGKK